MKRRLSTIFVVFAHFAVVAWASDYFNEVTTTEGAVQVNTQAKRSTTAFGHSEYLSQAENDEETSSPSFLRTTPRARNRLLSTSKRSVVSNSRTPAVSKNNSPSNYQSGATFVPVANINYLGTGYDILLADPRPASSAIDPGYRKQVFTMSNNMKPAGTADYNNYAVPENVDTFHRYAVCMLSYNSDAISDYRSYRQARAAHVSFGAGGSVKSPQGSFSGSVDYSTMSASFLATTNSTARKIVEASAMCYAYDAAIESENVTKFREYFSDDFLAAVANLPTSGNETVNRERYFLFTRKFGTHYVQSMTTGSLYWSRFKFTAESWSRLQASMEKRGDSAQAKLGIASLSLGLGFKGSAMSQTEQSSAEYFSSQSESVDFFSIGSALTPGGNWNDEVMKTPMPLRVTLARIPELLTKAYFPDDEQIGIKQWRLSEASRHYCEYLKVSIDSVECLVEGNITPPPNISTTQKPKSNFGGVYVGAGGYYSPSNNPLTFSQNCPSSFSFYKVGLVDATSVNLCMNQLIDPQGAFGGMWQQPWHADPNQPCLAGNFPICNAVPAGLYSNTMVNPVTGAANCPAGYSDIVLSDLCITITNNCHRDISEEVETGTRPCGFLGTKRCRNKEWRTHQEFCSSSFDTWIHACYRNVPDADIGGFYALNAVAGRPSNNPATGSTSCPAGYTAKLILENVSTCVHKGGTGQAFVCLKERS